MLSETTKLMIETKLEEIIDSIMKPYCCEKQKHRIKKGYEVDIDQNNDIVIDEIDVTVKSFKCYKGRKVLHSYYVTLEYGYRECFVCFHYNTKDKQNGIFDVFKTNVHCPTLKGFVEYKFYEIFQKYGVNNHYVIKFK